VQQSVLPSHDPPVVAHELQTSLAQVPLQQSENVVHAPPPAVHVPATQRSAPLHDSEPVHAVSHSQVPETHDSPALQPPAHPPPPLPLPLPVALPLPEPGLALQRFAASAWASDDAQVVWLPAATTASQAVGDVCCAQQTSRLAQDVGEGPPDPEPVPDPSGAPPHAPAAV